MTRIAYVDSSCIVANALGQSSAAATVERLVRFEQVLSSAMLEAELYSALVRERRALSRGWTAGVQLVHALRSLAPELEVVFAAGYQRGASAWHLATALYLSPDPSALTFLTLDVAQGEVARTLGFVT